MKQGFSFFSISYPSSFFPGVFIKPEQMPYNDFAWNILWNVLTKTRTALYNPKLLTSWTAWMMGRRRNPVNNAFNYNCRMLWVNYATQKYLQPPLVWITWHSFFMALSHISNRDLWGAELIAWKMLFQDAYLLWDSKASAPTSIKKFHPAGIQDMNFLYREINICFSCAIFCPRVMAIGLMQCINMTLISPYSYYIRKVISQSCFFLNSQTIYCHTGNCKY